MSGAYYNEHDPKAAAWLRELIREGLIADGEVDERSIADVAANDVRGFVQCHWFAGIGGWSLALRLAGWADTRSVWTGSCPCQPFSSAGAQAGGADARDLWPTWARLICECKPQCVFGEQVESALAHGWYDRVCDDLEREGYACGASGLPAASVGAFHIRQRLWFVAHAMCSTRERRTGGVLGTQAPSGGAGVFDGRGSDRPKHGGEAGNVGDADHARPQGRLVHAERAGERATRATGMAGELADDERVGCQRGAHSFGSAGEDTSERGEGVSDVERGSNAGFWDACDWIHCRDSKWRPVEPAVERLVDGLSDSLGLVRLQSYPDRPHEERVIYAPLIQKGKARVMRLRGYGNAIVPELAAAFIQAADEAMTAVAS